MTCNKEEVRWPSDLTSLGDSAAGLPRYPDLAAEKRNNIFQDLRQLPHMATQRSSKEIQEEREGGAGGVGRRIAKPAGKEAA